VRIRSLRWSQALPKHARILTNSATGGKKTGLNSHEFSYRGKKMGLNSHEFGYGGKKTGLNSHEFGYGAGGSGSGVLRKWTVIEPSWSAMRFQSFWQRR
jgi:hypothetical protein